MQPKDTERADGERKKERIGRTIERSAGWEVCERVIKSKWGKSGPRRRRRYRL